MKTSARKWRNKSPWRLKILAAAAEVNDQSNEREAAETRSSSSSQTTRRSHKNRIVIRHLTTLTIYLLILSAQVFCQLQPKQEPQPQSTISSSVSTTMASSSQPKGPTTTTSQISVSPTTISRQEEEVDLMSQMQTKSTGSSTSSTSTARQSRIYRIRAAPFNGKLQLPAPGSSFGARTSAPPSGQATGSAAPLLDCNPADQMAGDQMSASVAASSPTLRLTASSKAPSGRMSQRQQTLNATLHQLIGRMRSSMGQGHAPFGSTTSKPTATVGEVDESESLVVASTASDEQKPAEVPPQPTRAATRNGDSILSLIDDYDSKIVTNRTKAHLSCDSGEMILRLNFSEPFKGIVYPDHNRLSPCRFFGDGHHNYELRLPLRGCGTRQAAPRIFVNDVIVRFHKTLELEEDEVKTLICRYPPPLASGDSQVSDLLTNSSSSSSSSNSNRSPQFPPPYATGGSSTQHDAGANSPFELVDPTSGRPTAKNRDPGTTGNIETLSDNLIVAPPIGGQGNSNKLLLPSQTNDDGRLDSTGEGGGGNPYMSRVTPGYGTGAPPSGNIGQQQNGKLLLPPVMRPLRPTDIFNSRNSIISSNGDDFMQNSTSGAILTSGSGGGDPMRSSPSQSNFFERLSSVELLFLISSLMFLVLLALGLAGSYLCFRRREGRRSRATGGAGGAAAGSRLTQQQVNAMLKRKRRVPQASAALRRYHQAPHLHYATNIPTHGSYNHTSQLPMASSSPESDLSNRGLLASSQSLASGTHFAQYVEPEQHYVTTPSSGHLNPAPPPPQQAIYGRQAGGPPPVARKPQLPPVVGRRDTAALYGYSGGVAPYSSGRHPMKGNQSGQSELLIPTYARTLRTLGKPTAQRQRVPYDDYAATMTTGKSKLKHGGNQYAWPPQVDTNRLLLHRHHNNNLLRAKSLVSVVPSESDQRAIGVYNNPFAADDERGPLSREKLAHRQRQHYFSGDIGDKTGGAGGGGGGASSDSETERASGFRSSDNVNGNLGASVRQKMQPKLLLKSIEDSYITNLTEIYEQEYKMNDTRRPLSLMEWQSAQPATGGSRNSRSKRSSGRQTASSSTSTSPSFGSNANKSQSRSPAAGSGELANNSDIDSPTGGQSPTYLSANRAKLRSLTELDVDFAKSMPFFSAQKSQQVEEQSRSSQHDASPTIVTLEGKRPLRLPEVAARRVDSPDFMVSPEYDCVPLAVTSTSGTSNQPTSRQVDRAPSSQADDSPDIANYQKTVSVITTTTTTSSSETTATSGSGESTSATVIDSRHGPNVLKLQSPSASSQPNSPTRSAHDSVSYV